jgi:hypothetical protein
MSYPVLDYLPFDYVKYTREILPLWERVLARNTQPLKRYIQSTSRFSIWPHINCPLTIEREVIVNGLFNRSLDLLKYEVRSSQMPRVNFWDLLCPYLDALESLSDPIHTPVLNLIHSCLLYTFCCDLPLEEEGIGQKILGTILLMDEGVQLWLEYIERDTQNQQLWEPFNQLPSPERIGLPLFSNYYLPDWMVDDPRGIFQYGLNVGPSGFLTMDETWRLFKEYCRHETPLLSQIRSGCLRDAASHELPVDLCHIGLAQDTSTGVWTIFLYYDLYLNNEAVNVDKLAHAVFEALWKRHPEAMMNYQQRYYQHLWKAEDVIMRRFELAASRGWGMIMMAQGKFGE